MSKLEKLQNLKEELNVKIIGKENYPKDAPSVIVTNDNNIMNMIYVPMISNEEVVTLLSSSLIGRNNNLIKEYVNAFPICDEYSDVCIDHANRLLLGGISINFFENNFSKKYAPKLIFSSLDYYNFVYLLPVSIKEDKNNITVEVLEPINPIKYYRKYTLESDKETACEELMKEAYSKLSNEKSLKNNTSTIIFPNGKIIYSNESNNEENKNQYRKEVKELSLKLLDECGDIRC